MAPAPTRRRAHRTCCARAFKPQKPTKDALRSPAVVVLEKDGTVPSSNVGTRIGDYPPLDDVLAELP